MKDLLRKPKKTMAYVFARMLGIKNMREQCFLTAAAQNIKRLVMA